MDDSRKKPGWAFWTTVVAALSVPVLYVASYGPACWLSARGKWTGGVALSALATIYRPLILFTEVESNPAGAAVKGYVALFSKGRFGRVRMKTGLGPNMSPPIYTEHRTDIVIVPRFDDSESASP